MKKDIKLTKNITIQDVFKLVDRDYINKSDPKTGEIKTSINPLYKKLEKIGIKPNDPFSVLQDIEVNEKLAKSVGGKSGVAGSNTFVALGTIEKAFQDMWNVNAEGSYPFKTMYGASGVLQKTPDLLLKYPQVQQPRKTKKLKNIPPPEIVLKNLTEGIARVPDANTRAALAFMSLVPLRPSEVASLQSDDIDFKLGRIKESWQRKNKLRNPIELPELALEILRAQNVLIDLPIDTEDTKPFLFGKVTARDMTAAFNKHINPLFTGTIPDFKMQGESVTYEDVFGRKLRGSSDIRKLVPSVMASETFSPGANLSKYIKKIMGHDKYDELIGDLADMSKKFYLSPVYKENLESGPRLALKALQNTYAKTLNLNNVNELSTSFRLNIPRLTGKDAIKIPIVDPKAGGRILDIPEPKPLTAEDLENIELRRKLANKQLIKETLQTDISIEEMQQELQAKKLAGTITNEKLIEEQERAKLLRDSIKDKLKSESAKLAQEAADQAIIDDIVDQPELFSTLKKQGLLSRYGIDENLYEEVVEKGKKIIRKIPGAKYVLPTALAAQMVSSGKEAKAALEEKGFDKGVATIGGGLAAASELLPLATYSDIQDAIRLRETRVEDKDRGFVTDRDKVLANVMRQRQEDQIKRDVDTQQSMYDQDLSEGFLRKQRVAREFSDMERVATEDADMDLQMNQQPLTGEENATR